MEKNKKKFKILKWILLGTLVLLIGIGIVFSIFYFIGKKHDNNIQLVSDVKYLAKIDDSKYYIAKANKNISFWVEKKNNDYILLNSKGEKVDSIIKVIDDKYYIAREIGFDAGETYTLILKNNKFLDQRIIDANVVVFTIEREEVANFEYYDDVFEVDIENLDITNNKLKTTKYEEDDILLVKENDKIINAYQLGPVINGVSELVKPELSDIYFEFDLYKEFKIDYSNIILDTDTLGTSLAMQNQQEEFKQNQLNVEKISYNLETQLNQLPEVQFIKDEAKKTGNPVKTGIEIKTEENKLIVEFTINVEANGESFLGIEALSKHNLEMKMTFDIAHDLLVDSNLGNSISVACTLTEGLSLDINLTNTIDHEGFTGLTDDEYDKTVQDIIARLDGATSDTASGRATLGALEIPTGIAGVNIYFDLYYQTDTHLSLDLAYNQRIETSQTMGLVFIDNNFKPFMDSTDPVISFDFNAFGKINTKLGLGMDIGLSLISKDFANINLGNEFGIYADAYMVAHADYNSNDNPEKVNAYSGGMIEVGTYLESSFNANIDLFFDSFEFTHNIAEIKKPFLKIGENYMVAGIKPETYNVEVTGESAQIPKIYRQLLSFKDNGKITGEQIPTQYLKFTDKNGNDIINTGVEFDENNKFILTVAYEEVDGTIYTTEITFINKTEQKIIRIPLTLPIYEEENNHIDDTNSNSDKTDILDNNDEYEEDVENIEELINREFTIEEAMELVKDRVDSNWENSNYEEIPIFNYKYDRLVTAENKELYAIYVYTEDDINLKYASADWKEEMPDGSGYHYITYLVENKVIDNKVYYYTEHGYEDYSDGVNNYLIDGPGFEHYYDITLDEQPFKVNIFGY